MRRNSARIQVLSAAATMLLLTACAARHAQNGLSEESAVIEDGAVAELSAAQATRKTRLEDELAPGFLVRLSSLKDEKLNGQYRINADGLLKLPYNIRLQTAGMDEKALRSAVN